MKLLSYFIASQAKSIYLYKNIRSKLLKCCVSIYFNKQCLAKKVILKYTKIFSLNVINRVQL